MNKITLITNEKNRMEASALEQLMRTAELPGVIRVLEFLDCSL